jgi:poly(hydroxyalkanoate) depolymerase family esterase
MPAHVPKALLVDGLFVAASFTNRCGTRAYKTYVPALNEGRPRALVVMLHGWGQGADDFALGTRMNQVADELGFIVAYPEQTAEANAGRCWNWYEVANQQRDDGEPSLIAGITRDVIARHNVDPARVYVAGLSAGGAMAAIMGNTYPELYAAMGIHSGLAYAAASDLQSALAVMSGRRSAPEPEDSVAASPVVPTIVFHGDFDTTVHPRNAEQVLARSLPRNNGARMPAIAPPTVESGVERGRMYTRTTHADSSGNPAVEHWVVHGGGHAWSGGDAKGSFADSSGPDATRAMLRFFHRCA